MNKENNKNETIKICPVCGEKLVEIDDMNYYTSICTNCHSAVFEETDGTIHVVKKGIGQDGYNVSLDIFTKQLLAHNMTLSGRFNINPGEIMCMRMFHVNIYTPELFEHFYPMVKKFKMKRPYIYFKGYEKYLQISHEYGKEHFPKYFK